MTPANAGEMPAVRKAWLARLAHDLRDPITPLRFAVHQMRAGQISPDEQLSLLKLMDRQIDAVLAMADDVADLVRIERGDFRLHLGPAGLSDIVSAAVRAMNRDASAGNSTVNIRVNNCEVLVVRADDARLSKLLVHLLRIAMAGAHDGALAEIRCEADEDTIRLSLRNLEQSIARSTRLEFLMTGHVPADGRGLLMGDLIAREILLQHAAQILAVESTASNLQALVLALPRAELPEFVTYEP